MIEAVIFDMDGVLIDSAESAYRVRAKVLQEYGVDLGTIPDPYGEAHKSASLKGLLQAVAKHTGKALDATEVGAKMIANMHDELAASGVAADPRLLQFLSELKNHGVPLAVATSGTTAGTYNKLRVLSIEDFFDVIVAGDEVKNHKPDPESYVTALEKLGVNPAHTIVFEDSTAGVQAGVAAGAVVVGFTKYCAKKDALPGGALTIDNWESINFTRLRSLI